MGSDASSVLLQGPWSHRYVAANGARFHVAEVGDGPLVLLLHGFPQFWWTWREQLLALAGAGYRAVALDLRGYGASDKPPMGYDAPTLTADVAAVVRSLGQEAAILVGHGLGGWLAWSAAQRHPDVVRALAVIGAPHPRLHLRASWSSPAQVLANRHTIGLRRPYLAEHRLTRDPGYVDRLLRSWAAPGATWPSPQISQVYAMAMTIPFTAHSALEAGRWLSDAPLTVAGRRYLASLREPVRQPVLAIHGLADPVSLAAVAQSSAQLATDFTWGPILGAGHFPHEEEPERVTATLLAWLAGLEAGHAPRSSSPRP